MSYLTQMRFEPRIEKNIKFFLRVILLQLASFTRNLNNLLALKVNGAQGGSRTRKIPILSRAHMPILLQARELDSKHYRIEPFIQFIRLLHYYYAMSKAILTLILLYEPTKMEQRRVVETPLSDWKSEFLAVKIPLHISQRFLTEV